MMRWAGIEAAICSWWGKGDESDVGLAGFAYGARGLVRCAVHYEKDIDGHEAEFKADLDYLKSSYPLLTFGNKPVVFCYRTWDERVSRLAKASAPDWYVVTQRPGGDSQYVYDTPPSGVSVVTGQSITVSPGFEQAGQPPRLPRNLTRFKEGLRWAEGTRQAGWPWQLLLSWNEIIEGTHVEPCGDNGAYLQAVREVWR
jgi:hypothetical protein